MHWLVLLEIFTVADAKPSEPPPIVNNLLKQLAGSQGFRHIGVIRVTSPSLVPVMVISQNLAGSAATQHLSAGCVSENS
jgi:hypothetical protein